MEIMSPSTLIQLVRSTYRTGSRLAVWFSILVLLTPGCATRMPQAREPIFHPRPPDPPRIQFLTRISKPSDIELPPNRFIRFILGPPPRRPGITKPYGIAFDNGKLLICDSGAGVLHVADLTTRKWNYALHSTRMPPRKPINITTDTEGTLYVCDTVRRCILAYDSNQRYVTSFGRGEMKRPVDLAVGAEHLYVADLKGNKVLVYDKATRKQVSAIPRDPQSKAEELFSPLSLALDQQESLYVSDAGAFRVQKYDAKGRFVRSFGGHGLSPGQFARNRGIALDREGRLYVVDAATETIQIFAPDGKLLLFFPSSEGRKDHLLLPAQITIDYDHLDFFRRYAAEGFHLEYLVLVTCQYGPQKVKVYGFGHKVDRSTE